MRLRRALAAPAVLGLLLLAACNDTPEEPSDPATTEAPTAEAPTTEAPATAAPTEEPTSPQEPTDDGELPGEAVEIHPYEGAELGVVGVAADDVLHVRSGPGVDFDSVAQLEPLATGILATGHNRHVEDGSYWAQVEADAVSGWASPAYLAYLGDVSDITAQLDLPTADTVEEAGQAVAEQRMGDHPPSISSVLVDGPHAGDLHEVTFDVLGFGDDAILGERLHVFTVEDGAGFTVRTVEAMVLCARGVSEGLCI